MIGRVSLADTEDEDTIVDGDELESGRSSYIPLVTQMVEEFRMDEMGGS